MELGSSAPVEPLPDSTNSDRPLTSGPGPVERPANRRFRIGIDYRSAHKASSTHRGIGAYTRELTRGLSEALKQDALYLCVSDPLQAEGLGKPVEVKWPERPSRLHWMWDAMFLRRKLKGFNLDFFHATDPVAFPRAMERTEVLLHLHDVIPFVFWRQYADQLPPDFKIALRRSLREAARVAAIITDSECSRRDILHWTRADPERVHVVPFGCGDEFRPVDDPAVREQFLRKEGIQTPYLVYVGATDYRKNLPFLVRAFSGFREAGYTGHLYLVGEEFARESLPGVKKVREAVAASGCAEVIHLCGYLKPEDLRLILACTDALVFPSLYEGFGLPVLEAMSCGTPVVVSRRSSIPEVAGEAGVYFDPESKDDCVRGLLTLLDPELKRGLSRMSLERSRLFTWDKAIQRIVGIYEALERARHS